jgi:nicotinamidase-related amidase
VHAKTTFSCAQTPTIADAVAASGRTQIVLCGIEAHVCVLQTALGFAATGLDVAVAWDATSSRRESDRALAADRLRQAGVVLGSAEMVLFEWLGRAGTPEFKDILALVK